MLKGKTVAPLTLGCKVNQYETDGMIELLKEAGMTAVSFEEKADVYIYRDILKQDIKETAETENVTAPLFTRVYLDKGIEQDKETKRLPKFNIKITAYAIQADGITYDDAKTEMMEYVNNRSVEGL